MCIFGAMCLIACRFADFNGVSETNPLKPRTEDLSERKAGAEP